VARTLPTYTLPTTDGANGRQRWQQRYQTALAKGQVRNADFTTLSGMEVEPAYGPSDEQAAADPNFDRIGWPGEYPFTRGLYSTGYRGRTWTIRQFAGFGNAEQTNERYKMILWPQGGRPACRLPLTCPRLWAATPTTPMSLGEVGHCGVASTAADMDILFRRHAARRCHDLDDDQRPGRPWSSACTMVPPPSARASADARPERHAADGHLQGVHRPEGVHLPAAPHHAAGDRTT
jgi:hypothetical protein